MRRKIIEHRGRTTIRALLMAASCFLYVFGESAPANAATSEIDGAAPVPPYAAIADLVTSAPAIATVIVRDMIPLPPERSPGLAPGMQRFYVAVETQDLIRSKSVLAKQASFVVDVPVRSDHKPQQWKGRIFVIFGRGIPGQVNFFQLQSSTSLLAWSPQIEAMVRRVAEQFAAADSPPSIRAVTSIFHIQGAIQGEGETQIFLETANGDPISLSIVRRPDEKPEFGAALGEIIDEAAALPKPDTPLWYRLACGLPPTLPAKAVKGQDRADVKAAERDYEAFLAALGPCDRTTPPLP